MRAALVNGWVVVPYAGSDRATVEVSLAPDVWLPAYLDYDTNGLRTAKVRPPATLPSATVQVRLRVDGSTSTLGWLTIKQ